MCGGTLWWWNDRDEVCAVTMALLMKLHIRAMEYGAYREAAPLAEAWLALVGGPWAEGRFRFNRDVPYAIGVRWLHPLLARLQELSWDTNSRLSITEASTHLDRVAPELPVRIVDPDDGAS